MEFIGDDDEVVFNADQVVRGAIGCAAVSVFLIAVFGGLVGIGFYRALAG